MKVWLGWMVLLAVSSHGLAHSDRLRDSNRINEEQMYLNVLNYEKLYWNGKLFKKKKKIFKNRPTEVPTYFTIELEEYCYLTLMLI